VRYAYNRSRDIANGSLKQPIGAAANRQSSFNRFNSPLVNWTRVISPRLVNDLTFHADWFLNSIPAFNPDIPATDLPDPSGVNGHEIRFPSLQDGANFRIPQSTKFDRYQIRDNFSWVAGNHTVRFGAEWQHLSTYALFDLYGSGSIITTEDFGASACLAAGVSTTLCDLNNDGFVDDRDIPIAVALQSAAPSKLASPPSPPIVPFYPNSYFGWYIQDDWKARPNLTFNLGLRWETDDVLGQASNLHPCSSLTVADNTCNFVENVLGGHPGRDLKQFGPRVGFVWDPLKRGQTVIRGGYGIYYDRVVTEVPLLEALLNGRLLPLAAFNGSTCDMPTPPINPATGLPYPHHSAAICGLVAQSTAVTNQIAFDAGTPTLDTTPGPLSGGKAVFGIGINHIANNIKHPYVQQLTVGLQQQLGKSWVLSADAIHDRGLRSILGRQLRSTSSTSPDISCPQAAPGYDPCTITDSLTGRSDQVTEIQSSAKSWYDALLVSLQKKATGGPRLHWGFNANYTLSKSFSYSNDDQIPFNEGEDAVNLVFHSNNLQLEKGYSPTDERHRFSFTGVFEVPWKITISPIWTYASHVPMDSSVPALSARLPVIRRNALGRDIANGAALNTAIDFWNSLPTCPDPNPTAMPCNPGVTLAHVDPNLKFGDDFNSLDLRVTKVWTLAREQQLRFITEVINLFNITNIRGFNNNNYSGFNNNITSASFNQPLATAGGFLGSGGPRAFQFALRYSF
jgi:hypothetical protein